MKVYDLKGKRTLTVTSMAGAWIPTLPQMVLFEENW